MTYTIGPPFEDYEEWLAARAEGITASEIAKLAHSGHKSWLSLKAEKAGLSEPWKGNKYSRWGQEREPSIAAVIAEKYPWLEPNSNVLRLEADPRYMATPDMIGLPVLSQIKTHLWKGAPLTDPIPSHATQCQFEMLVTGAEENILVYEYYEETEHGFRVRDPFAPLHEFLIKRDDKTIGNLLKLGLTFFDMGSASPMDGLLADYAEADSRLASAKEDLDQVKEKIRHEIGEEESYKHVSELGSVTLSTPKPRRTLDKTAVERDFELTDDYYKTITSEPSLRVTPAKDVA